MKQAAVALDTTQVTAFYDEAVVYKVADFVDGNRRVDAAWATLQKWAPPSPRRILEIGCGLGAMSWRMAQHWPDAEVIGIDISLRSIEYAKQLFERPNLSYASGRNEDLNLEPGFDMIVLIDVYEHISYEDRPHFNASLEPLLSGTGRILMTFPTASYLRFQRSNFPEQLQPVDDEIEIETLAEFGRTTATNLLMFQETDIWLTADYAHAVFGRREMGRPVERRQPGPTTLARAIRKARSLFQPEDPLSRDSRLHRIERALGPGVYRPR